MIIADFHIHSQYSRATSRDCDPEHLDLWARRKGIALLGTGDFTHQAWRQGLAEKLEPAEEGLYRLKPEFRLPGGPEGEPRFLVTGEISSIYKKNGRVRKVHSLILLPGLEAAGDLAHRLEAVGNIHSDGRPILGLDCRDLLEMTLDACPQAVFIPAHIWTPHFSLFGAFSGFDSIEECFGDLTPHIHALETGLSSDPPMNWRVSALDRYLLVSNSDAHSPSRLGREANLLDAPLSYPGAAAALTTGQGFCGTIEFFPEEGKYHFDGHRNCGQGLSPAEAEQAGGLCPVCGKRLTTGVLHRVEQLADRPEGFSPAGAKPFQRLVPLPEVIAAATGWAAAGPKVARRYQELTQELGPEFYILREAPLDLIGQEGGPALAECVRRVRAGQVEAQPGYDGEYGRLQILSQKELQALQGQLSFFAPAPERAARKEGGKRAAGKPKKKEEAAPGQQAVQGALAGLDGQQRQAVQSAAPAVLVCAGPGAGKTKTLVARAAWLLEQGLPPEQLAALTFTEKAAGEIKRRLKDHFGSRRLLQGLAAGTFHSVCRSLLAAHGEDKPILSQEEALLCAQKAVKGYGLSLTPRAFLLAVSRWKNGSEVEEEPAFGYYQSILQSKGVRDYDDLLLDALALAEKHPAPFRCLLVDEFQDVNPLQYRLIRAWAAGCSSLFAIGDPNQAIYSFRGSDGACFSRFPADFPGTEEFRLSRNYRSAPEILRCAGAVLAASPGGTPPMEAVRPAGGSVRLMQAADEFSQAVWVAKEISRLTGGVDMLAAQAQGEGGGLRSFSDIAVLYRTHRQAEALELCLSKEGVPCLVTGRGAFLEDPSVMGILSFFRSLLAPGDTLSLASCLVRLFHTPAGEAEAFARLAPDWRGELPGEFRRLAGALAWQGEAKRYAPLLWKEKPWKLVEAFAQQWELLSHPAVERLRNAAALHPSMEGFLHALLLGSEGDVARSGLAPREGAPAAGESVSLMTLHGAKGLEFPVVFLCGASRGFLPLDQPGRRADPEEERRLLYVGMTRAEQELILTAPGEESPFLRPLPASILPRGQAKALKTPPAKQLTFF